MKLMTGELEKEFEKYPLYSQDGKGGEAKVVAKFFSPVGAATWFVTEGEKKNGDWLFFGYANLGDDQNAEFGYFRLSDLENLRLPYGMGIERDLYFEPGKTNIYDAIKQEGFTPPGWLRPPEQTNKKEYER